MIHGDTHLGNILIDNSNNIYYIDPRGYFGNKKLFGLHYYDYAKLMFGLSGYSIFDEMIIDKLNIIDNNMCGIMISQRNGISGKCDFEIGFHNNLILIYLHKVNYDAS